MIYAEFQDKKLSLMGFGTMRLPTKEDGTIDQAHVNEMTRLAMEGGVNYFDTAWPYHGGESEKSIGEALKQFPRESFYLATKYPGHQVSTVGYDPAAVFEEQLKKCQVEYFDFYLLHNVNESSGANYLNPEWGMIDYFKEQKRLGRIKHLGFSCHSGVEHLREFLDACGEDMEFCQIQLNYLDWTLQDAKSKYELLTERGIPVWVMEPVRGGKLANLTPEQEAQLKALRPDESSAAWALRFLQGLPNVKMILSGSSNTAQMEDNIKTFAQENPLTDSEVELLFRLAEEMKDSVPCTACRYCCSSCPMGLDIPMLLEMYNELRFSPAFTISMRIELIEDSKKPSACLACGKCSRACPQNIDIPAAMKDMVKIIDTLPKWVDICREREEAELKKKEAQAEE
ncbi:MAG: aldo/keto reductase [Oscillospiraceae bacterium]|nr:aldo/keto reductase [Oscillospiraceae bacterium]